ncbi:MAG: hypothetical protein U0736_02915 [Gemmataceae bacterium]
MSESIQSPELNLDALTHFAAYQLHSGVDPRVIREKLVERGMDHDTATTLLVGMVEARRRAIKVAGTRNLLYGTLILVAGGLVTALSYQAAVLAGGGSYVIASGAIVVGAFKIIHGLFQLAWK